MIAPHGSAELNPRYVAEDEQRSSLLAEAEKLPSLVLSSAAAANAVMLGAGYFSPLEGFMDLADALGVAEEMRTTGGLFWPIPVLNLSADVAAIRDAERIALRDPKRPGHPVLAIQRVESITALDGEGFDFIARSCFRTLDESPPRASDLSPPRAACRRRPDRGAELQLLRG